MNKKTILILSIVVLNILTSCNNNQAELKKEISSDNKNNYYSVEQKSNTTENNYLEDQNDKEISNLNDEGNRELMIDDKCIWCWKCAIIAPSNFVMDYSTLKAVVISQKDMFSEEVSASIQYCPVDSIHRI